MIRRFRIALKHSSPIYAQESSRLMPSLLGAPTNRYRLFVLLLGALFVYAWHGQKTSFADELRRRDELNAALRRDRDSVAEKLRVIWLHKRKLEATLDARKSEADKFQSKLKLKDSEINGLKMNSEKCSRQLSVCEEKARELPEKKEKDEDKDEVCQEKLQVLEEKMKTKERGCDVEMKMMKEELKQCETKIKQLTGGGAVEHYSQNETAHFNRNHKADEPLSFDRANIQHHIPNRLMLGKQLAETLEEARVRKNQEREQLEKHPMDREVKDQEVNEQPDKNEEDYKEH